MKIETWKQWNVRTNPSRRVKIYLKVKIEPLKSIEKLRSKWNKLNESWPSLKAPSIHLYGWHHRGLYYCHLWRLTWRNSKPVILLKWNLHVVRSYAFVSIFLLLDRELFNEEKCIYMTIKNEHLRGYQSGNSMITIVIGMLSSCLHV